MSGPAPRTHCKRGHPMSGENLYTIRRTDARSTREYRRCRTCKWITQRRRRGHCDLVPNAALREAVVRSEMKTAEIARLCGWMRPHGGGGRKGLMVPDQTRVRTLLGLKTNHTKGPNGARYVSVQKRIRLDDAEQIMRAIGLDPWELGL